MRGIAENQQSNFLKEQFVPDHVFIYVVKGSISFFDGNKIDTLKTGGCGIARKNSLVKFMLPDNEETFNPVIFCFDEEFLQQFQAKHKSQPTASNMIESFLEVRKTDWIDNFIASLKPYYKGVMQLDEAVEDLKYEELLIILLKQQPELAGVLFNYTKPEKINLEAFMNSNYKFNVSIERFAYLTGRSLSAFKGDFKEIFDSTPNRWLIKKRLNEAHFLIDKKKQKPSEIYLDLGFQDLSHFYYVFKKQFGYPPSMLQNEKPKK